MAITMDNIISWKENTLATARSMAYNPRLLDFLSENTQMFVLEANSREFVTDYPDPSQNGRHLYGRTHLWPPQIGVYKSAPSDSLPQTFWTVWNQSGMDHELMGHLYNFHAGNEWQETAARTTQVEFARFRGEESLIWKLAAVAEPLVRNFNQRLFKREYSLKDMALTGGCPFSLQ